MKITGDFDKLERLQRQFAEASSKLKLRLLQEGAIEARRQVRRSFAEGRDPYGRAWAPLKLRSGGPLRDTGDLAEYTIKSGKDSFVLTAGAPYAATHQHGAVITPKKAKMLSFQVDGTWYFAKRVVIPKRQMVPEGTWGHIWTDAFAERFDKTIREWFG